MNKELSRVSTLLLVMFVALFGSSTIIQWAQTDSLRGDPRNVRTILASFAAERGAILVDGVPIAESVPSDDQYEWQRQYPEGPLYAPVTGYNTLGQGNSGIEGAMNDELTGQASSQFLQQVEQLITGQDPTGSSVELTIDPAAQQAAMEALGDRTGAVVALDPESGDILALASTPTFDPNQFASHDTDAVIDLYNQMIADPGDPLVNNAIGGDLYFPGSVFKLVVAAAALESGDYDLDDTFDNPAELPLPGTSNVVQNANRGVCPGGEDGEVSIAASIIYSCNIPFAQLGEELGEDALVEQTNDFGYGTTYEMPVPVTASQYPTDLDEAQLMLTSFGQYDVRVTPMQVAMTTAAIANGGTMMQPQMVDEVIDTASLDVVAEPQPAVAGEPISEETASALHDVMVDGVQEGLASNAAIDGVTVGGKTGTAENGENDEPFNLWFTGFGETDEQSVAVAVVVVPEQNVETDTSNEVASPIGRAVIEAVLNS